jgi:hypothetical protein
MAKEVASKAGGSALRDEVTAVARAVERVAATQAQHGQQLITIQSTLQSIMLLLVQHPPAVASPHSSRAPPPPMPAVMPLTPLTRPAKCTFVEFKDAILEGGSNGPAMDVDGGLLADMEKDYVGALTMAVALHVRKQQTAEHDPPLKVCMQRRGEFQAYDGARWTYVESGEVVKLLGRAMKRVLRWYIDSRTGSAPDPERQFSTNHMISTGIETEKFKKTAVRRLYDALLG